MNFISSGNTSSASSRLLLIDNRSGPAPANARDSGPEFRAALDVVNTSKPARPEPAPRAERNERPDHRSGPGHSSKPAQRPAAQANDTASVTKAPRADKAEPTVNEAAVTEAPLAEADGEKSALLAQAGLISTVGTTEVDELQTAPTEETSDIPETLLTPLAPEVSGAASAAAGTILPPGGGAAANADAVLNPSQLTGGGNKAVNPALNNELNGLKTGTAELAEGEATLMETDGALSPDDFKQSLSRLLGTNAAADKSAQQTEQTLTKLAADPAAALTNPAQRPSEAQAPNQRSFVVQTGVAMTMGQPRWGQAVGERVLWLAAQNVSSAELRLDPPELGPMQVRVNIHQDQATVSFSSPHALVREALDQSATRLREMFSEQGLNLTEMDVSDQSFARQGAQDEESNGRSGGDSDADADEESLVGVTTDLSRIRLVDHYA